MGKFEVSLHVLNQHGSFADMRRAWAMGDELGADAIFDCDHFFPALGDPDGTTLEGWTLLGAMAEVVKRAKIGCQVTGVAYRNPHLLADMARTIDHISGGRLILGLGSGYHERDYLEYGYDYGTMASRFAAFERDLTIIKSRLSLLNPAPVQTRIPLLIGGRGEKVALRIVAEHADIWHIHVLDDDVEHKVEVFEHWLERAGRERDAVKRYAGMYPHTFMDIDRYVAVGFTQFNAVAYGPDYDLGFFRELLAWRDEMNRPV